MTDKVFTYEVAGKTSIALRHFCLRCDKPVLIAVSEMKVNELFFCTYCGLDSRMPQEMIDEAASQLGEYVERLGLVPPVVG